MYINVCRDSQRELFPAVAEHNVLLSVVGLWRPLSVDYNKCLSNMFHSLFQFCFQEEKQPSYVTCFLCLCNYSHTI